MALDPGTRFGSYEVAEPIGSGGMGEVYRATDTELKRDVAIKVLPESFGADADRLARFQREAEILASLNHPNIATIHGLEQADGQTVIVMELVEGLTLADRIKEGPIPPDEALSIARQIADALEVAHANQIVHRDLKPANVKLRDDGTVKVLDFGISKSIDPKDISGTPVVATPAVTETGVILGTAAYMSPEQARGKFVDQRTDIWAFGCLLFEMLTGQPAFGGEDVMAILARVIDRDTDLSSMPGTISPAVRHTIKLCLEKDPKKRIADIRDVRLAFAGTFESELPRTAETVTAHSLWQRAVPITAALVIVGLAVGTAVWFATRPEPPLIARFVDELPDGIEFQNAVDLNIAVSPKGDMIAYGAADALYVRTLSNLEPRRLEQTAGEAPVHPVFSPDGEWIAYWSESEGELKKVAVQGGAPVTITPAPANPYGPHWTADDFILYGRGSEVVRVPASGGQEPEVLYDAGAATMVAPVLLPGSETLLVSDLSGGGVQAITLATGESTRLFDGVVPNFVATGHILYYDGEGILARAFDPSTLEFGGPVSVVDDVFAAGNGPLQFAISASGMLAYMPGQGAALGALTDAGTSQLAITDANGTIETLDVPASNYVAPRVSPDSRRLAVVVTEGTDTSNIFVYGLSGQSEMRQLTFDGDTNAAPSWKDAETLVFVSNRSGRSLIYEQPVDGGLAVAISERGPEGDHAMPAVAPDGRLSFVVQSDPGPAATWVESDDGGFEILAGGDSLAAGVSFSPDGGAMAYMTQEPGVNEISIFVEPYPPDGSKRLVASGTDRNMGELAMWPRWVRNGADSPQTLMYQLPLTGTVAAVDVTLPELELGNRRTLFRYGGVRAAPQVDSIPGTERFVINWEPGLGDDADAESLLPRQIVIVENWVEELKRRVPTD